MNTVPLLARSDTLRDDEFLLLTAIASLAGQLPRDLTFYTPVLGAIREGCFKIKGARTRHHGQGTRGYVESRDPRATKRYGT
jgi:hypothetical protein